MEGKSERALMLLLKIRQFEAGDRVVRMNTWDQTLFIVVKGVFFGLDDTYPQYRHLFGPGAILGIDQFIHNDRWKMDLISKQQGGMIAKLDMHTFNILKEETPAAAISLYNRLMRMKSYNLIYERKNNEEQYYKESF